MRTRPLLPLLPCLLAGALLAGATTAQTPSWSPEFATAGLGGTVFALATYQNELYAGGEWFAAKGGVIRGIARFDGANWRPVGTGIDLVNYSYPYLGPWVRAMAVYQGELILAGIFDHAGGQPAKYIARWDGTTLRPLGGGLELSYDEANIRGLAVYNNELYAVGLFDRAGGLPVNGIARWDGTTWRAVGSGLLISVNNTVGFGRALQVHNGLLIAGGEFDRAGGVVAKNIAAWNGTAWTALGGGASYTVWGLESFGTSLVAAGQFQIGANVEMVAAWNGATWSALGSGAPTVPVTTLRAVGTRLYADAGATLARFDGTSWSTAGVATGIFSGVEGTSIRALHAHGSELIAGGQFTIAGPAIGPLEVASACVIATDMAGGWRALGGGLGLSRPADRLLPWRGRWVAAGGFGEAGAVHAIGVAIYDGDRWHRVATFDGPVWSAAIHQDALVVSGAFTTIDGKPFPGIARFDGTTWHAFGTIAPFGLYAHAGGLYGTGGAGLQQWNGTTFVVAATVNGVVGAVHSHRDGLLYVATDSAFQHAIHTWNGTQRQQIGSANDFIHALGSHGNDVVVGGRFSAVQGVPAQRIARWNGVSWQAMPAPVSGYSADAFAELDGALYAGVSGDPRGLCLKFQNNVWQALGPGIDGLPKLLFTDRATASVYASGVILSAGGVPARNLAEWRTQPAWRNRLHGLGGAGGVPLLLGRGALQAATPISWTIEAPANLPLVLALGASRVDLPLLGGTLVPAPDAVLGLATDAQGVAAFATQLPAGLAAGTSLFAQAWILDATGPKGLTATNALQCTVQ